MKTIVLVRHAKSSWDQDMSDVDRPLSTRGFSDANVVAGEFLSHKFIPDMIFTSPANRAMTTCQIFMGVLSVPNKLLTIDEMLYDFGGDRVHKFIKSMDNSLNRVMIFGHNHALTALANNLGDIPIDNLPTSGLVVINFNSELWRDIQKGTTKLILKPKDLK